MIDVWSARPDHQPEYDLYFSSFAFQNMTVIRVSFRGVSDTYTDEMRYFKSNKSFPVQRISNFPSTESTYVHPLRLLLCGIPNVGDSQIKFLDKIFQINEGCYYVQGVFAILKLKVIKVK